MENTYWAGYILEKLSGGGLHLDISYPDSPIANGKSKDIKLVSINDLLKHNRFLYFLDETQKRSRAASMLDEINDKYLGPTTNISVFSADQTTRDPSNPNNYFELLLGGQVILLPHRDPSIIESYRTYTMLSFSLNNQREHVTIDTNIGKDFVNLRDICLHSKDETADPRIEIEARCFGGSHIPQPDETLEDILEEENRLSPEEHIDRIIPVILSAYKSIVAKPRKN